MKLIETFLTLPDRLKPAITKDDHIHDGYEILEVSSAILVRQN
jgi:hypothetical protein